MKLNIYIKGIHPTNYSARDLQISSGKKLQFIIITTTITITMARL
jgi:hypothetical protein